MKILVITENLSSHTSRFIIGLLCLVGLAYRNRDPSSASRNCVKSNGRAVGKARIRRLMDSPHRRIRTILQAEGGHMSHQRRHYYIVSLANSSKIHPYVDIPIWSYP